MGWSSSDVSFQVHHFYRHLLSLASLLYVLNLLLCDLMPLKSEYSYSLQPLHDLLLLNSNSEIREMGFMLGKRGIFESLLFVGLKRIGHAIDFNVSEILLKTS